MNRKQVNTSHQIEITSCPKEKKLIQSSTHHHHHHKLFSTVGRDTWELKGLQEITFTGLPNRTTEKEISNLFRHFSPAIQFRLFQDPSESSKRIKKVTLIANNLEQESRILARTFRLHGREINPIPATSQITLPSLNSTALDTKRNEGKLFLKNIPAHTDEKDLRAFFEKFGEVEFCHIVHHRKEALGVNCYGFLKFCDIKVGSSLVRSSLFNYKGDKIIVSECKKFEKKQEKSKRKKDQSNVNNDIRGYSSPYISLPKTKLDQVRGTQTWIQEKFKSNLVFSNGPKKVKANLVLRDLSKYHQPQNLVFNEQQHFST